MKVEALALSRDGKVYLSFLVGPVESVIPITTMVLLGLDDGDSPVRI